MPRSRRAWSQIITCWTATLTLAATVNAGGPRWNGFRQETSIDRLAKQIDRLERSMQFTGRVTVKAPDVWGEARLTAHRQEFERQMAAQIDAFAPTLNAEIAIADQAFLQQALSLSAATRGGVRPVSQDGAAALAPTVDVNSLTAILPTPTIGTPADGSAATSSVIVRHDPTDLLKVTGTTGFAGSSGIGLEPEILLDQRKRFLDHLHEIRRINEGDDTVDSPGNALNLVRIPVSIMPGDHTRENYGAEVTVIAEPHVTEELLPSTFRELVVNDLVDQLALPIVKFLELTWDDQLAIEEIRLQNQEVISLKANLSKLSKESTEEHFLKRLRLLEQNMTETNPERRKELLLKAVLTHYGLEAFVPNEATAISQTENNYPATNGPTPPSVNRSTRINIENLQTPYGENIYDQIKRAFDATNRPDRQQEGEASRQLGPSLFQPAITPINHRVPPGSTSLSYFDSDFFQESVDKAIASVQLTLEDRSDQLVRKQELIVQKAGSNLAVLTSRSRRSRYPLPSTALNSVLDFKNIGVIAQAVFNSRDQLNCRDRVTLTDVQGFLRNELGFSYDFLKHANIFTTGFQGETAGISYWYSPEFPTSEVVHRPQLIARAREKFFASLDPDHRPIDNSGKVTVARSTTEALAWAIAVESALLNDQLNKDIQRVSQDPNCGCMHTGDLQFYGPDPSLEARQAFVQYVKCRWPIRVFALDPVTQQQNVADTFSLRRESQLAIALAFSQRRVSASSLTRFMRRIEQDIRTISLNNTHVAFGAGNDTFGWRFYPRVQTPDVESNLTTVGRDLIWGGPNRDARLKRWRIEPGMRECVALVVMPSFIRHVRFDIRTNWLKLVPGHGLSLVHKGENGVTLKHTMDWSRDIQEVENSIVACVKDEHLYRPGETERIVKRAQQLSRQLPLNTMFAQVPNENTLGGFEMFASGITDLAPELVGFYGSPGVDPERETTLLLVGDNFSIHDTRVIAGNTEVQAKLLSRDVIEINMPRHVRTVRRLCEPRTSPGSTPCCAAGCNDIYVEVLVGTPYGVSSPLYIPVVAENGTKVVNLCGANGSPTPISPGPGEPISSTPSPQTQPSDPQISWDSRGTYELQYVLKSTASSAAAIDTAGTKIRSKPPHELQIVSPKDRSLPAPTTSPPNTATVSVWIEEIDGNQIVPNRILFTATSQPLTATKNPTSGIAIRLTNDAFSAFHIALRKEILEEWLGSVMPAAGSSMKLRLRASVTLADQTMFTTGNHQEVSIVFTDR